jgi:hypothetical protein
MTNYSFFFHFEELAGYQSTSKFSIFNRDGELLFNANEGQKVIFIISLKDFILFSDSTCCQRCCCANSREFTLHIRDTADNVS